MTIAPHQIPCRDAYQPSEQLLLDSLRTVDLIPIDETTCYDNGESLFYLDGFYFTIDEQCMVYVTDDRGRDVEGEYSIWEFIKLVKQYSNYAKEREDWDKLDD